MGRPYAYLSLTLVISILSGIILPFVLGVKNFRLIVLFFTLVWLICAIDLGIWVLSWYMLSPDRKFLPGLSNPRSLIQGQLFYGQSTSPYKLSRLNCEYKYLQLLLSQCIYPKYIFACVYSEIKPRGGEPD